VSYNGWTNYETWAVALWIDNEEGSYLYSRELVAAAADAHPEYPTSGAADALKEWQEEQRPDLGASVWADLLGAAFDDVDWHEIAENYLSERDDEPTS